MPCVVRALAFTVKAIFTRTFTGGIEIRAESAGIIIKNRWILLNLLSMHIPLTKKNVTLVGQTITSHERVSAVLRFIATGRSYEDLKFSIISPQTLRYIISETCDTLYKSLKILTLSLL